LMIACVASAERFVFDALVLDLVLCSFEWKSQEMSAQSLHLSFMLLPKDRATMWPNLFLAAAAGFSSGWMLRLALKSFGNKNTFVRGVAPPRPLDEGLFEAGSSTQSGIELVD